MHFLPSLAMLAGAFFLGVISPGPNFVLLSSTAARCRKTGLFVSSGFALAAFTWATAAACGLAVLVARVGWAYHLVQMGGAAYLIYLGLKMCLICRGPGISRDPDIALIRSRSAALWRGYLVNMTNPKSAAFYTSVFATLLPRHAPLWVLAAAILLTTAISLIWYGMVALLFSVPIVKRRYEHVSQQIDRLFGIVLISLGVRLAVSR